MNAHDALLPCPLCGNSDLHSHAYPSNSMLPNRSWWGIRCGICELAIDREGGEHGQQAVIAAWNRRAPVAVSEAEVRELVEAAQPFATFHCSEPTMTIRTVGIPRLRKALAPFERAALANSERELARVREELAELKSNLELRNY